MVCGIRVLVLTIWGQIYCSLDLAGMTKCRCDPLELVSMRNWYRYSRLRNTRALGCLFFSHKVKLQTLKLSSFDHLSYSCDLCCMNRAKVSFFSPGPYRNCENYKNRKGQSDPILGSNWVWCRKKDQTDWNFHLLYSYYQSY